MSNSLANEKGGEYRPPSITPEAEQALLVSNEATRPAATCLDREHFVRPLHGRICDAAPCNGRCREITTEVTLTSYREYDNALAEAGGAQHMARLAGSAATIIPRSACASAGSRPRRGHTGYRLRFTVRSVANREGREHVVQAPRAPRGRTSNALRAPFDRHRCARGIERTSEKVVPLC